MNRQELERELGHAGARELLESAHARPARLQRTGRPTTGGPIGFHFDGEHIVICTATTSPKPGRSCRVRRSQ